LQKGKFTSRIRLQRHKLSPSDILVAQQKTLQNSDW